MRYETKIGWRYLYHGGRDELMQRLGLCCLGGVGVGAVILALSHGSSPVGVLVLVLSMILASAFFLFSVFSVFTSVSVLGVVFGVAALTVVLAVTTGFQKQFRDKVLGVNAHVIVLKSQATFAEYRDVMKTAREIDPDVLAVQPFIFAEMLATRGKGELSGVAIKGIDPKLVRGVLDLDKHMIEGSLDSLLLEACPPGADDRASELPAPAVRGMSSGSSSGMISATEPDRPRCLKDPPIIMGKELAHKLKAKLGDDGHGRGAAVEHRLRHLAREDERAADAQVHGRRDLLQRVRRVRPPADVRVADRGRGAAGPGRSGDGGRAQGPGRRARRGDRAEAGEGARRAAVPGPGLVRAQPQPVHGAERCRSWRW